MSQACSIDWTALGTWFLVGTGIAGVIVAAIQLRKLNENERLKNTLELLRRYDSVLVPFMHEGKQEAITAAVAVARCTPEVLEFFGSYGQQPPSSDYKLRWASVTIAVNYFKTVGALWERRVIDHDLFFSIMAPQSVKISMFSGILRLINRQPPDLSGLTRLAAAAQKYLDAHPLEVSPEGEDTPPTDDGSLT